MKENGKILFVIYAAPIAYNHGVAVLSSILKEKGFETELFIANGNLDLFKQMVNQKWLAICFAHCIKKDFDLSIPYIDVAVESGNDILLGGTYHRRNNPNQYDGKLKICRGDGEKLYSYFQFGSTEIFDTNMVTKDLDSLPIADYELFKNIPYDGHIKHFPDCYKLPYTISRGCIGKCKFCEVQHQTKGVRIRHKAMDDLDYLNKTYNPELWFFTDELFPYHNQKFMVDFLARMSKPYFAFIRADINPVLLQSMIDCGLKGCAFGVESGDEFYRNEVLGKNLTDNEIYKTAEVLDRNGVYYAHFYMIRTEGETFKIKLKTDKMINTLGGVPMVFDFSKVNYNTR